ncbi:MAG: hypothetical protein P8Z41_04630, partial [Anaerolineales bacterium]
MMQLTKRLPILLIVCLAACNAPIQKKTAAPTATPEPTEAPTELPIDTTTPSPEPVETANPFSGLGQIMFLVSQGSQSDVYVVNTDGTQLTQRLPPIEAISEFDWSPDGTRLAVVSNA